MKQSFKFVKTASPVLQFKINQSVIFNYLRENGPISRAKISQDLKIILKGVKLDFQPTLEAKASGVCTGLICKPGRVTLARFQRVMGYYQMHIATG
jgi:hypothetical protein